MCVGEHHRVVGGRIGLDTEHVARKREGFACGAVHLGRTAHQLQAGEQIGAARAGHFGAGTVPLEFFYARIARQVGLDGLLVLAGATGDGPPMPSLISHASTTAPAICHPHGGVGCCGWAGLFVGCGLW